MCDEIIIPNWISSASLSSLLSLMNDPNILSIGRLQRSIIHTCTNGSYGVAYLSGIASRKIMSDARKLPSELLNDKRVEPN